MSNLFFIFVLSKSNNMEILFFIIGGIIFGIGLGIQISQSIKPKCNHVWEKIEDGTIHKYVNSNRQQKIGFMKVYECQHCKEMRKEQVFI